MAIAIVSGTGERSKMYVVPRRRKFNGKTYKYHHSVAYLRSVELDKEDLKNKGYLVRAIKMERKGFGFRWYLYVWKRDM
jgi:hypothetical protein